MLVVAHRLSTVAAADRILVLEHGCLRALGTHDELMSGDALYRDLAETQLVAAAPPRSETQESIAS